MRVFMRLPIFFTLFLLSAFSVLAQSTPEAPFKPFIVYDDKSTPNRYVASGYMPTGECVTMDEGYAEQCQSGQSCIKVNYDVVCSKKGRQWAGVYWLNPADNWGDKKGGYNLSGAKKLVFWAKGAKGGEQIAEFKIGGLGANKEYPDSDTVSIGPVILTNEWREYTIDLRDRDLSNIAGGFAWVANADANPDGCEFYLDHIQYE